MKYIFLLLISFNAMGADKLFALDDLIPKIKSGVKLESYCADKAALSGEHAKKSKAPAQAIKQIKYWVNMACILETGEVLDEFNKKNNS